jgi:hypothetical protein
VEEQLHVTVLAPLFPEAEAFLKARGCTVRIAHEGAALATVVILPLGTKRELRSKVVDEHYRLTLPDGIVIMETRDRHTGMSALSIPAQPGMEARLYSLESSEEE